MIIANAIDPIYPAYPRMRDIEPDFALMEGSISGKDARNGVKNGDFFI